MNIRPNLGRLEFTGSDNSVYAFILNEQGVLGISGSTRFLNSVEFLGDVTGSISIDNIQVDQLNVGNALITSPINAQNLSNLVNQYPTGVLVIPQDVYGITGVPQVMLDEKQYQLIDYAVKPAGGILRARVRYEPHRPYPGTQWTASDGSGSVNTYTGSFVNSGSEVFTELGTLNFQTPTVDLKRNYIPSKNKIGIIHHYVGLGGGYPVSASGSQWFNRNANDTGSFNAKLAGEIGWWSAIQPGDPVKITFGVESGSSIESGFYDLNGNDISYR